MLRKIAWSLLFLLGAATTAFADEPTLGPPVIPPQHEGTWYGDQLALRTNPAQHASEVMAMLGNFDGRLFLQQASGEDRWQVFWSAALGHVQVVKNGLFVAMAPYFDAYGRPAFEGDEVSGWVDMADEYLYAELTLSDQPAQGYIGLIADAELPWDGQAAMVIAAPTNAKKCVCKGTVRVNKEKCDAFAGDCINNAPCRYVNEAGQTVSSNCIYSHVPKELPPEKEQPPQSQPPEEPQQPQPPKPPETTQPDDTCGAGGGAAALLTGGMMGFFASTRCKRRTDATNRR